MNDPFEDESLRLERQFVAGDFAALIEAVLLFSDQEPSRPLPSWAWRAVVESLLDRLELKGSGRGVPGPKQQSAAFERRRARYYAVKSLLFIEGLGPIDLAWVNGIRAARGLSLISTNELPEEPSVFEFAHFLLRSTEAQASAKTIQEDFYRVTQELADSSNR